MNTKQVIEALLFASENPLKLSDLVQLSGLDLKIARKELKSLIKDYEQRESAIEITKVKNSYVMQLKSDYLEFGYKVGKPELDEDVLKTLAVISYYQPIKQSKLREMIGEKVYEHIDMLKSKNLIYLKRSGKTFDINTTKYFGSYFGIDAKSKDEIKEYLSKKLNLVIK